MTEYDRNCQYLGVMEYDQLYKIIIVGDSETGKSQLLSRFCSNEFSEIYTPTVVMEHTRKMLKPRVCAHLWDLAGNDIFREATSSYYRNTDGVVVLYDITKVRSFENVSRWIDQVRDVLGPASPPMMLLGNKLDLRHHRSVTAEDGHKLAKSQKTFFFEVSASDATNVQRAFELLTNQIEEKFASERQKQDEKEKTSLEQGSKSLVQTKPLKPTPLTVVQKQPKPKFAVRDSAQRCIGVAKESCCKFSCLC